MVDINSKPYEDRKKVNAVDAKGESSPPEARLHHVGAIVSDSLNSLNW